MNLNNLLLLLLPFLGSIVGWFTKSAFIRAKTSGVELDNVEKAIKIWREMAIDFKEQIKHLSAQTEWLEGEVKTLLAENEMQKLKINSQNEKIEYLESKLAQLMSSSTNN